MDMPENTTRSVDSQTLVLSAGQTFGVFERSGDIPGYRDLLGVFHCGTRFVSKQQLLVNDKPLELLSANLEDGNEQIVVDMINDHDSQLSRGVLHVQRNKRLDRNQYVEQIKFTNYSTESVGFKFSMIVNSDFKDIFEIRGFKREKRGEAYQPERGKGYLVLSYKGLDGKHYKTFIMNDNAPQEVLHDRLCYRLSLEPGESANQEFTFNFQSPYASEPKDIEERLLSANISSSDTRFTHWFSRASIDLHSLIASTAHGPYPFAGIPWFNAPFGRDGIITCLQLMWLAPQVAKNALLFLAKTQATKHKPEHEAEPGKIVHEMRDGEMANLGEVPYLRYYGSVDVTPLFLVLAGRYYRRTADFKTIEKIWPQIKSALDWIEGNINKEGFLSYQKNSKTGLTHQGWKDADNSIMHSDGQFAKLPVSLVEVQGYLYEAYLQLTKLAGVKKDKVLRKSYEEKAAILKENFNHYFWDNKDGYYYLAIDGDKQPCKVIASNMGHCLSTDLIPEERVEKVVGHLLSEDMYSGWGIRTLSAKEKMYSPVSYHNGTIWPHDNSLIVEGMAVHGYSEEVKLIYDGMYNAASYMDNWRLPELFCGFKKRPDFGPSSYPTACSPQAWSTGAAYLMLQACLGMTVDGIKKRIMLVNPQLPNGLPDLTIKGLMLDGGQLDIEFIQYPNNIGIKVLKNTSGYKIITEKG